MSNSLVTLNYHDLINDIDLSEEINRAYGPNGLGALTISNIPGYSNARKKFIPLTHSIAHLKQEELAKLEHPNSMWNVGWSHGKEKLGDTPDFSKGSYYCNPIYDIPEPDEQKVAKHPFFFPKNIWPTETLPNFEPTFKDLGAIMFNVVVLLCKQIDRFVAKKVPTYPPNFLFDAIKNTRKIKGRGLYYFPVDMSVASSEDGWIGWHNDSGFLTALTKDMFFDDASGEIIPNPDPNGGLWIIDRNSGAVKVEIPEDELAIQCGECLQIITGGLLFATPHSVRASYAGGRKIGRGTFPVFIDSNAEFPLSTPDGIERNAVFDKIPCSKVPPLDERWLKNGVPFVEFLGDSFRRYYEFAMKKN